MNESNESASDKQEQQLVAELGQALCLIEDGLERLSDDRQDQLLQIMHHIIGKSLFPREREGEWVPIEQLERGESHEHLLERVLERQTRLAAGVSRLARELACLVDF